MSTLEAADHLLLDREFETSVKVTGIASALFAVVFGLRLLSVFGALGFLVGAGGRRLVETVRS